MSVTWTVKNLLGMADVPISDKVIEFPAQRPTFDALIEQAKSAIREQRTIDKDQADLNERRDENSTRLSNIQAAIIERLHEIGIDVSEDSAELTREPKG